MPKKLSFYILTAIIILSFIFRISGINYGLPLHFHPDEWSQIAPPLKMFDWNLNPAVFYYPSFLIYFLFAVFKTLSALAPEIFTVTASKEIFYLTGRLISTIFGTATVLMVYSLGKKLFDEKVALLSAFFFSISPLHVHSSHFAIVDIPLVFFICLSIYFCVSAIENNYFKNLILAGFSGGFAASTKYTAFLLLLIIYATFLIKEYVNTKDKSCYSRDRRYFLLITSALGIFLIATGFFLATEQSLNLLQEYFSYNNRIEKGDLGDYLIGKLRFVFLSAGIFLLLVSAFTKLSERFKKIIYLNYIDKKIILVIIIFLTAFLLVSPYTILDSKSFLRDFKFAFKVTALGIYENKSWILQESYPSFLSHLTVLVSGNGILLFVFFISGILLSINRKNIIPLLWIAIYFSVISSWKTSMSRFLLPIIPFVAIYSSKFIFFLMERLRDILNKKGKIFTQRLEGLVVAVFIIISSVIPFKNSIAINRALNQHNTLLEAFKWIEGNIRENSKIVLLGEVPDLTLSDQRYWIKKEALAKIKDRDYFKTYDADYMVIGVYKYSEPGINDMLMSENHLIFLKEFFPDKSKEGPLIRIFGCKNKG